MDSSKVLAGLEKADKMKALNMRIDARLLDDVNEIARKHNTTTSAIVRELMRDFVADARKRGLLD